MLGGGVMFMFAEGKPANGAERVAARVAGGGEEGGAAHAAGLGGLLDEGTRSGGGGGVGRADGWVRCSF